MIKFYISGLGRPTKVKRNCTLCKKVRGIMHLTAQYRRGRAVGVVNRIWTGGHGFINRRSIRLFSFPKRPGRLFPGGMRRGVNLATNLHLALTLRVNTAMTPFPLCALMAWAGKSYFFTHTHTHLYHT